MLVKPVGMPLVVARMIQLPMFRLGGWHQGCRGLAVVMAPSWMILILVGMGKKWEIIAVMYEV